jgi:hypothetical protein
MLSWQQGYRDDGDAGLLSIGARYYDPQVKHLTSFATATVSLRARKR